MDILAIVRRFNRASRPAAALVVLLVAVAIGAATSNYVRIAIAVGLALVALVIAPTGALALLSRQADRALALPPGEDVAS
jgi:hypothetical protein